MAERDPYADAFQPLSGARVAYLGTLGVLLVALGTVLAVIAEAGAYHRGWSVIAMAGSLGCYLGAASCGLRVGRGL